MIDILKVLLQVKEWGVEICNLMVATTTGTGGNENHKGEYFKQNKIK